MSTTLRTIERMYYDWRKETGLRPTRVYMGRNTRDAFCRDGLLRCHIALPEEPVYEEVMGMRVYIVTEPLHLFVC